MEKIKLNCCVCNKIFEKNSQEYNRVINSGRNYFFCSLSCQAIYSGKIKKLKKIEEYNKNPNKCLHCGKEILPYSENVPLSRLKEKKFCDHSCAAIFNNSKRLGKAYDPIKKLKRNLYCLNCYKILNNRNQNKYCNLKCQSIYHWKIRKQEIEKGVIFGFRVMKKYLIEKYGNKCLNPDCCWDWSKNPNVKVEIEHIDGNSLNNKLINLTLLCPNCHSLSPTYKNKNKGNGRHFRRVRYAQGKSY